ncbi:MAG: leucine-rich repeat protein, partial [Defluviitaleaceae bacterium]|nr:leucine-rich repeat protein [Defluviitaleaceae bacterium]
MKNQQRKSTMFKRAIALLLTMLMVAGVLPGGLAAPVNVQASTLSAADTIPWLHFQEIAGGTEIRITGFELIPGVSPTAITIPAEINGLPVTEIGNNAFASTGLVTAVFEAGSQVRSLGNSAFRANPLITMTLPDTVLTIGADVFRANSQMTSITVPAGLHSIGNNVFNESRLVSIDLSHTAITVIPAGAFAQVTTLNEVLLPNGLTTIETNAFNNAFGSQFQSIVIPPSVTTINGNSTFNALRSNTVIDLSAHAPGSISGAPWYGFNGIVRWSDSGNDNDSIFVFNPATGMIAGIKESVANPAPNGSLDIVIPTEIYVNGVPHPVLGIADGAFGSRPSNQRLGSVDFEPGHTMTAIPTQAFRGSLHMSSITNMPDSITYIGLSAFRQTDLTSIVLPQSLETIGQTAFRTVPLTSITFPPNLQVIGPEAFMDGGDNFATVIFEGDAITTIAPTAFDRNPSLANIHIEQMDRDTVSGAPWGAGSAVIHWRDYLVAPEVVTDDTGLWSFNTRTNTILSYLGNDVGGVHAVGPSLDLVVPSVLYFAGNEFNITAFGDPAAASTGTVIPAPRQVGSLTFSDGITHINVNSSRNVAIGTLNLGNTVQAIGNDAFLGSGLTSVDLPTSIRTIGAFAFANNQITGELVIPGMATNVGTTAFNNNPDINRVTVRQYRLQPSDGVYDPANNLFLLAPANVANNAPFGAVNANEALGGNGVFFMDDPMPIYTVEVIRNTTTDATDNRVTIRLTVRMNNNLTIQSVTAPAGMPDITVIQQPTTGHSSWIVEMVVDEYDGNGVYNFITTYLGGAVTYNHAVTVDEFNYRVTFNGNSQTTGVPPQIDRYFIQGFTLMPLPDENGMTRDQAVFIGWTTEESPAVVTSLLEENALNLRSSITFGTESITLYAAWAEDLDNNGVPDYLEGRFTVFFDGNGATEGLSPNAIGELFDGDRVDLPGRGTLAMDGYVFLTWSTESTPNRVYTRADTDAIDSSFVTFLIMDEDDFPGATVYDSRTYTVFAIWARDTNGNGIPDFQENTMSVRYFPNGGLGDVPVDNFPYGIPTESNPYANLATILGNVGGLNRVGFTWAGWNTAENGSGTQFVAGDQVELNDDLILFAQWNPNLYPIVFMDFDPIADEVIATPIRTVQAYFDIQIGDAANEAVQSNIDNGLVPLVPTDPTPPNIGWVFVGWTTDGTDLFNREAVANLYMRAAGGLTFTAVYVEAASSTVIFDLNGGSLAPGVSNFRQGQPAATFVAPIPTREGYTFTGWQLNGNANQTTLTNETDPTADPANGTFGVESTITVYAAMWDANSYDVVFLDVAPGTEEIVSTVSVDFDTVIGVANVPADRANPVGYTFVGWTDGVGVFSQSEVGAMIMNVVGGMTFMAVYAEIVPATVMFDFAGGTDGT